MTDGTKTLTVDEVIEFKSIPQYFEKEKSGLKNNTVRIVGPSDERIRYLVLWGMKKKYGKIRIRNTKTDETFERQVRDISYWNDMWIITWDE